VIFLLRYRIYWKDIPIIAGGSPGPGSTIITGLGSPVSPLAPGFPVSPVSTLAPAAP
jgi:hypothetical protein